MGRFAVMMATGGLVTALLAAAPAGAETADGPPPPPPPRPEADAAPPDPPPLPPDDPERNVASEEEKADVADPPPNAEIPHVPVPKRLAETDVEFAACLAALDILGTEYEVADPVEEDGPDCGIARPLIVRQIVPGVALRPDSRLRCATARALAEWVGDFVIPAASRLPGRGRISALDHGSTYVCRRRNNASEGRMSEHAYGNAVDVMGFRFEDGDSLPIRPRASDGSREESFQQAVRSSACLDFTTVIGPGTNAAHADHLHLDIQVRKSGYRLCQ